MKTIRRYHLQPTKNQSITLPVNSEILTVQLKGEDSPVLWALVDPEDNDEKRTISLYTTGTELPDDPGVYKGTFQLLDGSLEFHAFESETYPNEELEEEEDC